MPRFRTNSPLPVGADPPEADVCPTACSTKAFSLLEIVAVIAIIGILGGTIAPLAVQLFTSKRGEVTVDRLEEFKKAIIGNPFVIGDDVRSSFGYLGDMGNLPANLQNLYIRGVQPTYSYDSNKKTGAGWRGPYVNPDVIEDLATLGLDAYMQQLLYNTDVVPNEPYTGATIVGSLTSTGPNRTQGGAVADDRKVYIFQSEAFSTVSGFLKDTAGNGVAGVRVTMNYPVNGTINYTPEVSPSYAIATAPLQRSVVTANGTTYPIGYFEFRNIPYGNRSITIESKLVYAPGSARASDLGEGGFVMVSGNKWPKLNNLISDDDLDGIYDDIELSITNLSTSNITVAAVKIYFYVNDVTAQNEKYSDMWLASNDGLPKQGLVTGGGKSADGPGNNVVRFTGGDSVTINGTGAASPSYIVRVQSPQTHIPELRLQNYPAGATAKMYIMDFLNRGNDPMNVSGIPFKMEFYDTWTGTSGTLNSTIFFTPNVN